MGDGFDFFVVSFRGCYSSANMALRHSESAYTYWRNDVASGTVKAVPDDHHHLSCAVGAGLRAGRNFTHFEVVAVVELAASLLGKAHTGIKKYPPMSSFVSHF